MRSLLEFLSSKPDTDPRDLEEDDKNRFNEPPMTIVKATHSAKLNWRETATKMQDWNDGKRRENIKACNDAKLIVYWEHCKSHGFDVCCEKCEEEANRRGWTFTKIKQN